MKVDIFLQEENGQVFWCIPDVFPWKIQFDSLFLFGICMILVYLLWNLWQCGELLWSFNKGLKGWRSTHDIHFDLAKFLSFFRHPKILNLRRYDWPPKYAEIMCFFFYFKETSSAPRSIFLEPSHPLKYACKKNIQNIETWEGMTGCLGPRLCVFFSRQPRSISKTIASQWAATSSRQDTGQVDVSGDFGG